MSLDFFLQNRAHQIARLCTGDASRVDVSGGVVPAKRPPELAAFCDLVDRICAAEKSASPELSEAERKDLDHFERSIVRLRFVKDNAVKQPAVQLIKAVFGDADYYSGLKPLPQYTDKFAYELLFPSWLNLLTALMLPRAKSGKPRVEGQRQGVLFEFLGKVHASGIACERRLVGLLTFIACRFDAPLCEELLHRCVDLFCCEECKLIERIDSIEDSCRDARHFQQRLRNYLTVRHSLEKWPPTSSYPISYRRPALRALPENLSRSLRELDEASNNWDAFFAIAEPLCLLINSEHLVATEFMEVIEARPDLAANLLRMIIRSEGSQSKFLCTEGQACLAKVIESEAAAKQDLEIDRLAGFATAMAPKLAGFSDSILGFFCKKLVHDQANRTALLDACISDESRRPLLEMVVERASKTSDDDVFLKWLSCASVISRDAAADSARNTLQALDAVIQNRSIGGKEFSDLVTDLQSNTAEALTYLDNPIMAAGGKSARMAALYMTLSEVAHTFQESGRAENFSVIRAKYSAITNMDDD